MKGILAQWTEQYDTVGLSYKPVSDEFYNEIYPQLIQNIDIDEKTKFQCRELQRDQIFLGLVALKHHAKKEVNRIFNQLTDAGIRGVIFSKEDILRSKSLAQDLGIDTGWNSWVSLDDDPDEKITNWDGNLVLPFGIEAIKKHIEKIDCIPLQVQILCKANDYRTKDMFKIYQENTQDDNDIIHL